MFPDFTGCTAFGVDLAGTQTVRMEGNRDGSFTPVGMDSEYVEVMTVFVFDSVSNLLLWADFALSRLYRGERLGVALSLF